LGLRGPQPKPADRRQRRNKPPGVVLRTTALRPPAPDGLLKATRDRWHTYWVSELSHAVREPQVPIVERLFARYDERERAYRAVRKQGRVTKRSQGQLVAHPLLKYIDACDAEIRQLEDRLGLSPRSMAQLGGSFAKAQKSLDDLNNSLENDDEDDVNDVDPRLEVLA
jgi:P27 family predicted phage terminase small subunit